MPASSSPRRARRPGRRERRRAETRERLFRAALRLFAEHGFNATTIEDITEAADVGKGTFFNYFPSKEHVLAAFAEVQLRNLESVIGAGAAPAGPLEPTLRRLILRMAEEPGRSPALVRGMLIAVLSSEPVRRLMRKNLEHGRRFLAEWIAGRQRHGEIQAERDPMEIARGFQQMFFGTMVLWSIHPASALTERLEATFPMFWSGLIAPVAGGRPGKGGKR